MRSPGPGPGWRPFRCSAATAAWALRPWRWAPGEADRRAVAFLQAVIAWTEERMQHAPPPARPPREDLSGDRLRQALEEVRVGSWDWNIETGELVWDEAALELSGTRPSEFTSQIETG